MIKVAVIGAAGRMGRRLVANIAASKDLTLTGALEFDQCPLLGQDAGILAGVGALNVPVSSDKDAVFAACDTVIDFATGSVIKDAAHAAQCGCNLVIGTTGLTNEQKAELKKLCDRGARIVQAPNMSVGVNLLFYLTKIAAQFLDDNYDVEIVEMHHNQKKDAPSGTAARLAEVVCEAKNWSYDDDVRHGRQGLVGARTKHEIGMHALRGGDVVGDHTVIFAANGERLELSHKASSRDMFANGALKAVRFLATARPGLYDMQDVLNLK